MDLRVKFPFVKHKAKKIAFIVEFQKKLTGLLYENLQVLQAAKFGNTFKLTKNAFKNCYSNHEELNYFHKIIPINVVKHNN